MFTSSCIKFGILMVLAIPLVDFEPASNTDMPSASAPASARIDVSSITSADPLAAPAMDTPWGASHWTISEFQPNIKQGGRANTIAVKPKDNNIMLVASESGGLFKSKDRGATWKHIETLAPYYTNAIAFVPGNSKVLIATTSEDFSKSNQGGIWRSPDEGDTWTPVLWLNPNTGKPGPMAFPAPPEVPGRYSAFDISIAPDTGRIYVATSAGIAIGTPDGTIWSHRDVGFPAPQALTVLALTEESPDKGNRLLVGGAAGITRSNNGGKNWLAVPPKSSPGCDKITTVFGCIADMHALGGSPVSTKQAYVVNGDKKLFHTLNAGETWEPISGTPAGDSGCGGISFIQVKTGKSNGSIDLYFGNRCDVSKLTALPLPGTTDFNYTGTWIKLISDHGDTRHLAFDDNNIPLLLATDGGLHKTADGGGHWTYTGGGPAGYNALQIYQVKGQWIDDIGQHNLYFGTQDNKLWSSADSGKTWVECVKCNEGDFYGAEYHVGQPTDSQITIWNPTKIYRLKGTSFSADVDAWTNPPGGSYDTGRPNIVKKNFHVQWVEDAFVLVPSNGGFVSKQIMARGLAVTHDFAKSFTGWKQYALISPGYGRLDQPRISYPQKGGPILYQAISNGFDSQTNLEIGGLARLVPKKNAIDATTDLSNMTKFGGFGMPPTMEVWYRVFAVDPWDPNHLLAPDVIHEQMMESTDGGDNWTAMPDLTNLVTNGGQLNFRGRIFLSQLPPLWALANFLPISQVSAISFYPDNPQMVALGTVQNGIFISADRGKTWKQVPGSEKATLVSSLHWRAATEIIVSTYGRGLWRLTLKYIGPVAILPCRSPDCFHIYHQRPPEERPSPYDQVVVTIGGFIRGIRVRDGILKEVFVQPGTVLAYAADSPQQLPEITVTETTASLQSLRATALPRRPAGATTITGLTLKRQRPGSEFVGVFFSPRPRSRFAPASQGPTTVRPVRPGPSPIRREPHIEIISGPETTPGRAIELKGHRFPAGIQAEIKIDNVTVQTVLGNRDGNFAATVPAPAQFGFHVLTVAMEGRVVDGTIIGVRPNQ